MASLFVIQGRDQGRRFDLDQAIVSLGRDSTNAIRLHDSEVSRHHAEIRKQEAGGFLFVDLESSNGSFVNDDEVDEHQLTSGDRLLIGRTLMIFTAAAEAPALPPASVDIIGRDAATRGSRIVKALSHEEGSELLRPVDHSDSPWLARARSNLQVMYRTALAVSHTLDIDQLLSRIMDLIFEWVEADRGCIMLVDQETDQLLPKVSRNRKRTDSDEPLETLEISRTILDYVLDHKEGVLTSDAREDQRWDPAASIVKMGVREAICVPMQGRYGVVGVVYIDTYTSPGRFVKLAANKFSEEHLKLMIAIGHQAALAIEDTSYYSAMVQAERLAAMGQTIATLSHHIKNILQGIRGGSYLIEEGLKGNDQEVVRKGWSIVEKNQEKISSLVMDMLTFSKEREPDVVPAKIQDVVADVVELMEVRAKEVGVTLEFQASEESVELMFDPDMMHRAVLNVVTNAIDACEHAAAGCVSISCGYSPNSSKVWVTVSDNGEGIGPAELKKVFSVFESRKGSRGTGLGLPVSQKILREHGGGIEVDSAPGSGSCFKLSFPAVHPAPRAADTQTDPAY